MKNSMDSNFAIAILALVAACVGFAFWLNAAQEDLIGYKPRQLQLADKKEASDIATATDENELMGSSGDLVLENDVDRGSAADKKGVTWKKYENQAVGISFLYDPAWGEVTTRTLSPPSGYGSAININFSGKEELLGNVLNKDFYKDFVDDGRGGSYLMDHLSFKVDEWYIEHYFRSVDFQKEDWKRNQYSISKSQLCGYSTNIEEYGWLHYHGTCNTKNEALPVVNFYTSQRDASVPEDSFIKMIESFKVLK